MPASSIQRGEDKIKLTPYNLEIIQRVAKMQIRRRRSQNLMNVRYGVIIVAAGQSARFLEGKRPTPLQKKPFVRLGGEPLWSRSAAIFRGRDDVDQILLVVSPEDRAVVSREFAAEIARYEVELVDGGAERFLSVANALKRLSSGVEYVAVHDAARPCATAEEIDSVFAKARETGAAILATRASSSFKRSRRVGGNDVISESVPRDSLWEARTPQVFERELLTRAYEERSAGATPADDAELVSTLGINVALVEGRNSNIKVTRSEDLALAEFLIERARREDK